jgi:PEP-CTERM motif
MEMEWGGIVTIKTQSLLFFHSRRWVLVSVQLLSRVCNQSVPRRAVRSRGFLLPAWEKPNPNLVIPMKKTLLALAMAAGITSFAGNAKAQNDVTFTNPMSAYNIYLEYDGANWTVFNNGNMPVNVSNPTGTNFSSRDANGLTIAVRPGGNPSTYIGSDTNISKLAILNGGGVNTYGANSAQRASFVTSGGIRAGGVIIPNNSAYNAIAYIYNSNVYYGWINYTNNSDASQIQLLAAYINKNPNEEVTIGVSHNQEGPVVYGSTSVPEPSTYALFGLGALALVVAYRRKVA